jgi:hypothetical protein
MIEGFPHVRRSSRVPENLPRFRTHVPRFEVFQSDILPCMSVLGQLRLTDASGSSERSGLRHDRNPR